MKYIPNIFLTLLAAWLTLPYRLFATSGTLENPLALDSVQALIFAIVNIFRIISTPIVVFFIIYSGFLFVTAQGNAETLDRAKKALLYAIIGGVVIAGSLAIGVIVENTASEFRP